MLIFKCKMCGGALEVTPGATVATCEYCGTQQTLPRLDSERRANLYNRANHFRRNNEFDKAAAIYEQILNEDDTDAEAYWSLVLCRYGIEYVEDPATHRRLPTVNRAQLSSIFADADYKAALQRADGGQRLVYETEAHAIDDIQKGFLEISKKEKPFDVFICYKETDAQGRRTQDSVLANDLYHQLTQEGFRVFFARITLEDKLGTAYEPYIFAALQSARVMVVLGTRPEHFNAVWVKNEWSRYLALIRGGAKKVLIPAYKGMDPYDLPEEFSHLQAQDMSKLGFMQDLIRGIKKLADTGEKTAPAPAPTAASGGSGASLLRRAMLFLEDGDWASADEYCEKVLDIDPENARAYLGKLMAEMHIHLQEELLEQDDSFEERNNYQKAIRFADEELANFLRDGCNKAHQRQEIIQEKLRIEGIYKMAGDKRREASHGTSTSCGDEDLYMQAAALYDSIADYQDAAMLSAQCQKDFRNACKKKIDTYQQKIRVSERIWQSRIKDVEKRQKCEYAAASTFLAGLGGWILLSIISVASRNSEINTLAWVAFAFCIIPGMLLAGFGKEDVSTLQNKACKAKEELDQVKKELKVLQEKAKIEL